MPFYFRIPLPGPFGYSKRIGGHKRKRSRQPVYQGTLPGWRCEHNHRTESAAKACADKEARRRGLVTTAPTRPPATHRQEPPVPYPEPAPYIYCTVTAARYSADHSKVTLDLVSDSGEVFEGITAPVSASDPDPQALSATGCLQDSHRGRYHTGRQPDYAANACRADGP